MAHKEYRVGRDAMRFAHGSQHRAQTVPHVTEQVATKADGVRLMTAQEAADRLCMSHAWLRKKIATREVPCVRLGRAVRFTEDHLRHIIESHTAEIPANNGGRGSARTVL